MFGISKLSTLLLASSSSKPFSFQNERLQNAVNLFYEAEPLIQEDPKEAAYLMMQGILSGRKIVQQLVEEEDGDDAQLAMEWIVASYLRCSEARLLLQDYDTARSDAWAACSYSNNQNLHALIQMVKVCETQDDSIGQIQYLKLIQQIVDSNKSEQESLLLRDHGLSIDSVMLKIIMLEKELEEKYNSSLS